MLRALKGRPGAVGGLVVVVVGGALSEAATPPLSGQRETTGWPMPATRTRAFFQRLRLGGGVAGGAKPLAGVSSSNRRRDDFDLD